MFTQIPNHFIVSTIKLHGALVLVVLAFYALGEQSTTELHARTVPLIFMATFSSQI